MRHIVIIEDEPDIANLLACRSASEGFRVATATDGRAGFHAVHLYRPDLTIRVSGQGRPGRADIAAGPGVPSHAPGDFGRFSPSPIRSGISPPSGLLGEFTSL